jgi:hypothetical protein
VKVEEPDGSSPVSPHFVRFVTPKSVRPFPGFFAIQRKQFTMEAEIVALILGTVLPVYPVLFVIHQRIGRYDEVVEEFKKLQDEHQHMMEALHGN